ncbi:general L-amino acid transport system permease protein [Ancylobacter sp. 3268]|uniref:amino acid ABC transporter permease n=1 Tax=Ancylobacter sp. 3268 TaxID=2817752 RepID=UPI00285913B1|nr:ABC transporter permease subunit [Ancylobacter sp. 3268]MDR6953319.1 general L-amino acid transport system permease protein [Ancylobacter sp. 3268]
MKAPHALLLQGVAVLIGGLVIGWFAQNAASNLARRSMELDFGFLGSAAGFSMPFQILSFAPTDTYFLALVTAFANTLLVSALGVVTATVLGLGLGVLRLSPNWLLSTVSGAIVELVRNTPQLLQIVFWYVGVLQLLPLARQSLSFGDIAFLNIRGLFLPAPVGGPWSSALIIAFFASLALVPLARRHLAPESHRSGLFWLIPPLLLLALVLSVDGWSLPALKGFNFVGGMVLPPELVALWAGLSLYTAAFIAEIVRASVEAIGKGQVEAARSLGLKPWLTLRLVVLPQALRLMIPQMTNQYLNLIKSSSLGAAIAYPEIVQIFAGTVLNQSGRAIEVMVIVMGVFLMINLAASAALAQLNQRVALKER